MKKKLIISTLALVALSGVGFGVYTLTKPELSKEMSDLENELADVDIITEEYNIDIETEEDKIEEVELLGLSKNLIEAKNSNPEVIGYLSIPSIGINEPVCKGSSSFYLNNNYKREPDNAGAVFIDEMQVGFDRVNLLHGHNMKNGKIFGPLQRLREEGFMEENEVNIHLHDGISERVFRVTSMFRTAPTISFELNQIDGVDVKEYIKELQPSDALYIGEEPTENDALILNTCYSDGTKDHMIVVAQSIQ